MHVMVVFGSKIMQPSNHKTFIFCLGIVDMVACCVSMSFSIVDITHPLVFLHTVELQ